MDVAKHGVENTEKLLGLLAELMLGELLSMKETTLVPTNIRRRREEIFIVTAPMSAARCTVPPVLFRIYNPCILSTFKQEAMRAVPNVGK